MSKNTKVRVIVAVFLVVISAPFIRAFFIARSTPSAAPCINNLRVIQSAKDQWMLENSKATNAVPMWDAIRPYFPSAWTNGGPVCPQGGTYTLGRVGEPPTCSIGGRQHTV